MWRDYPVLCGFFCSDTKFLGMAARMSNKYFLYDLRSNALQARSVSLPMAGKKRTIKVFEMLKKGTGQHETEVDVNWPLTTSRI